MKHIALRSKSVRSGDRPYTTPGLGDRSHSLMIAYQYGKAHNSPVTIHLTDDKWSVAGGEKSAKKKKSTTILDPSKTCSFKVEASQ